MDQMKSFRSFRSSQELETRARLYPIGPIACNRAPRQRGPRATPNTSLRKLTLSIEVCLCSAGAKLKFF